MAVENLNSYKVIMENGDTHEAVAESIEKCARLFSTQGAETFSITRTKKGVSVLVPEAKVKFSVTVTPVDAANAGASALPNNYTVDAGEKVLFQAVAPPGFKFDSWTITGVPGVVSTEPTTYIEIKPLGATEVDRNIHANFSPEP